jgi:universal stress protein A
MTRLGIEKYDGCGLPHDRGVGKENVVDRPSFGDSQNMKFKPVKKSAGVVIELSAKDAQLPTDIAPSVKPVFRLKRILVPIDFSECSKKALQYAICFAKEHGAKLTVLYVAQALYPIPEMGPVDVPLLEDQMLAGGQEELAKVLQTEIGEGVPAEGIVRLGNPYSEIVGVAKSRNIDLIIISTHGRTGLKHVFLGSTAESVVRYAPCPVLVVREQEHEFIATADLSR